MRTETSDLIILIAATAKACGVTRQAVQHWRKQGWAPIRHHEAIARVNGLEPHQMPILLRDAEHAASARKVRMKEVGASIQAQHAAKVRAQRAATPGGEGLRFHVPGPPVAKQRPRHRLVGKVSMTYTPKETRAWSDRASGVIRATMAGRAPMGSTGDVRAPVEVAIVVVLPRPKSLLPRTDGGTARADVARGRMWHDRRPDIDNFEKAALDALVSGGALHDDGAVARITSEKVYAALGEEPGVHILLSALADSPPEVV